MLVSGMREARSALHPRRANECGHIHLREISRKGMVTRHLLGICYWSYQNLFQLDNPGLDGHWCAHARMFVQLWLVGCTWFTRGIFVCDKTWLLFE